MGLYTNMMPSEERSPRPEFLTGGIWIMSWGNSPEVMAAKKPGMGGDHINFYLKTGKVEMDEARTILMEWVAILPPEVGFVAILVEPRHEAGHGVPVLKRTTEGRRMYRYECEDLAS